MEPEPGGGWGARTGLALVLAAALFAVYVLRRPAPPAPTTAPPQAASAPGRPRAAPPPTLPFAPQPTAPATAVETVAEGGFSPEDVRSANALVARLNARSRLEAADLAVAEDLLARHPANEQVSGLLESTLLTLASQDRERRDYASATTRTRRAAEVRPSSLQPRSFLLAVLLDAADWGAAEAAARELLSRSPSDADAHYGLGYALFRQDRNREAAEALLASLALRERPEARALLDRLLKGQRDERGMVEQQLAHFHVRYDGDTHEDVGREVLRGLERHFATLARALDHQPAAPVAVVLFSREQYFDASGAPAWSGGVYDTLDGRIRMPIGGLSAALAAEVDSTLLHELTHAFAFDMSRGLAPRDVQEGLAQYMEGKRIATSASPAQLRVLASGRAAGVGAFYLGALAFVEHLVDTRGMGGIKDLLRAMAETGSVDEAFRRVHGRDYAAAQAEWREAFRRRYGA
jgi:tetratricopeptide (TPR) repeat protein